MSQSRSAQVFRRMVFNILIDKTDDHEKNHALLVNVAVQYDLSPAYDVPPSGQALGYQQFRVGDGASPLLAAERDEALYLATPPGKGEFSSDNEPNFATNTLVPAATPGIPTENTTTNRHSLLPRPTLRCSKTASHARHARSSTTPHITAATNKPA